MATGAEEQRLLKPTDIPLIITSASSSPDTARRFDETARRSSTGTTAAPKKLATRGVGSSLKYEIGRNKSAGNLVGLPVKWSSVRVKGTGYHDSRKSVVKIEPCNGMPNIAKDYGNLKSPNASSAHMKANIGNVSRDEEDAFACFVV